MDITQAQDGGKQARKERKNGFGLERQKSFLSTFASTCNLTAACAAADVARATVFLRRRTDPEFKAAFEAAREQAVVNLESDLIRRGIELVEAATPEQSALAAMPGLDAKLLLTLIQQHRRYLGRDPGHGNQQRSDPEEAAGRLHALMVRLRLQRLKEEELRRQEDNARDARRGS